MATLIGILILGTATILQTTIVSRINLLHGSADLVLLVLVSWVLQEGENSGWQWTIIASILVGAASAMPVWVVMIGYLLVTGLAKLIQARVWQLSVLSLFTTTFVGNFLTLGIGYGYLILTGTSLPPGDSFNLIVLPSIILNLILALPIYGLIGEITDTLYAPEVEV